MGALGRLHCAARGAWLDLLCCVYRYILYRIGELFNVEVTLDPKPIPGDWNGAGGHTNYSTKATRTAPGGYDEIVKHCKKLEKTHALHIAEYGEGNERRLTGKHEVCAMHGAHACCVWSTDIASFE